MTRFWLLVGRFWRAVTLRPWESLRAALRPQSDLSEHVGRPIPYPSPAVLLYGDVERGYDMLRNHFAHQAQALALQQAQAPASMFDAFAAQRQACGALSNLHAKPREQEQRTERCVPEVGCRCGKVATCRYCGTPESALLRLRERRQKSWMRSW